MAALGVGLSAPDHPAPAARSGGILRSASEPGPDTTREVSLLPVLLVVFFVMMGTGMLFPLLAQIADAQGGGPAGAGLFLSVFAAARLCANPPAGFAADRFGRRPVMTAGLLVVTLGSAAAWFGREVNGTAVAIGLLGCGSATFLTAALAAVADASTPENRGRQMSRYQTAALVGIALGPVAGGLLSGRVGLLTPFLVQGGLALLGIALVAGLVRDGGSRRPEAEPQPSPEPERRKRRFRVFASWSFFAIAVFSFILFLTRTATNWQLVPVLARLRFGYSPELIGVLLTAGATANLGAQPLIGPAIDRWGAPRAVLAGAIGIMSAFLLLTIESTASALWGGVILLGVASGVLAPAVSSFAIEVSEAGHGATLGALRASSDAGLVLGPLLLGQLLVGIGLSERAGLLIATALMAVSSALFVLAHQGRFGLGLRGVP